MQIVALCNVITTVIYRQMATQFKDHTFFLLLSVDLDTLVKYELK